MQKLITGLHHFQSQIFQSNRELYERLSKGQSPETLFITCSDSRINPNLFLTTEPGDLFLLQNAGNLIPAHGCSTGGEAATIEFAVVALGVKDIIVCGHSECGAVQALLNPEKLDDLPTVKEWLKHAEATRRIVKENYTHLAGEQLLSAAIQENVLVQLQNLKTHPTVASRLSRGLLTLHGWTYRINSGQVFSYRSKEGQFLPLTEAVKAEEGRLVTTSSSI